MAGDGIKITAALREKFNAFVGADVLTKEDEGELLIDASPSEIAGDTSRLRRSGDGVIGIQYRKEMDGYEKLIVQDGTVKWFRCLQKEYNGVAGYYTCTRPFEKTIVYQQGDKVIQPAPGKISLAIIGLFGTHAVSDSILEQTDPTQIRSTQLYFQAFTQPPAAPDLYDGPSGQDGDCR